MSQSKQIAYFQRARCLGALAVVLLHVLSVPLVDTPVEVIGHTRAFVWYEAQTVLTRWAVPVFFMITGALLLDPEKRVGWRKSFSYALRMLVVLATFGLGMNLLRAYQTMGGFGLPTVYTAIMDTLCEKGWSHLWYLYALIGFYLLLPFYRAFAAQASKRDLEILIAIIFVFDFGVMTVNQVFELNLTFLITVPFSLLYFYLGYYAHRYLTLNGKVVAAGIASIVVGAAFTAWYVFGMSRNETWVHSPNYVIIVGWSLTVFLLMKRYLNAPLEPNDMVSRFAALSFGVYLFHPPFIQAIYRVLGWGPNTLPPVVFELSVWGLAVVGSAALTWALRLIPPVRKIL